MPILKNKPSGRATLKAPKLPTGDGVGRFRKLGVVFHVQATKYIYPWKQHLTPRPYNCLFLNKYVNNINKNIIWIID